MEGTSSKQSEEGLLQNKVFKKVVFKVFWLSAWVTFTYKYTLWAKALDVSTVTVHSKHSLDSTCRYSRHSANIAQLLQIYIKSSQVEGPVYQPWRHRLRGQCINLDGSGWWGQCNNLDGSLAPYLAVLQIYLALPPPHLHLGVGGWGWGGGRERMKGDECDRINGLPWQLFPLGVGVCGGGGGGGGGE